MFPPKHVRALVEQFEDAWHAGAPVEVGAFVQDVADRTDPPLDADSRRPLVVWLIEVDLEFRWKRRPPGTPGPDLHHYAARVPDLGPPDSWPKELILAEYQARRQWGDQPDVESFVRRFPSRRDELLPELVRIDEEVAKARTRSADRPTPPEHDLDRTADGSTAHYPAVPGYEVRRELGRGGMGVVYLARHVKLDRLVALKMVVQGTAGRSTLNRFLAEAGAVAAVRHPNVVQVYDYGENGGAPFLALEYLPGGTLADVLRDGQRLSPAEAAALVAKVARGVAAAHARGVVHRDLKPGNVLLDDAREPKVADFGLAKRDGRADLTRSGAILGTPAYMSPEQADGDRFIGPQADVWALGAILYEALTGRRPFSGSDAGAVLRKVRAGEFRPPRARVRGLSRDLDLICRTCLERSPSDRYPTAAELADDLERYLRGEPIAVRPAGLVERTYKQGRARPPRAHRQEQGAGVPPRRPARPPRPRPGRPHDAGELRHRQGGLAVRRRRVGDGGRVQPRRPAGGGQPGGTAAGRVDGRPGRPHGRPAAPGDRKS
ncbi:MAG: serine/threonine protein kinase, partial [Gemmataceae bacterium]|nr:serine/threonine protein kinase [Gemmataceae bacterium]